MSDLILSRSSSSSSGSGGIWTDGFGCSGTCGFIISGALIAIGAIFLIIPGFATDFLGLLIIFPPTRKMMFKQFSNKNKKNDNKDKDYIEGEYKDLDDGK